MNDKKILILDYSTSRIEASAIGRWMPTDAEAISLYIDSEASFPTDLIERGFTHVIHSGLNVLLWRNTHLRNGRWRLFRMRGDKGVAQMGICFGHQLICLALVGRQAVRKCPNGFEVGWSEVSFTDFGQDRLGVGGNERVWQHHFDEVVELPEGSELVATNEHAPIQAYINREQNLFGMQFHPEFDLEIGNKIYLRDKALIEAHGYDVAEMVGERPSLDTGTVFFGRFLGWYD